MPMFELEPVEKMRWHAAWAVCDDATGCVVGAEDEGHARRLAAKFFIKRAQMAVEVADPWARQDLVKVRQLNSARGLDLPLGQVIPVMPWVVG
jgi:hypothetical protein